MKGTYLVFEIQCYDEYNVEADIMTGIVLLQLIAKSESEAILRAKKLIKKKGYRLNKIIEKEHGT